jgi:hypothetical protein
MGKVRALQANVLTAVAILGARFVAPATGGRGITTDARTTGFRLVAGAGGVERKVPALAIVAVHYDEVLGSGRDRNRCAGQCLHAGISSAGTFQ